MAAIHNRAAQMLRGEITEKVGNTKKSHELMDVLQVIATDTGDDGAPAYTGLRSIAERAGCAVNTASKRIDLLIELGYIGKEPCGRGHCYPLNFVDDCTNDCINSEPKVTQFVTKESFNERLSQIERLLYQISEQVSQNDDSLSQNDGEIDTEDRSLEEEENARACEVARNTPAHLNGFNAVTQNPELVSVLKSNFKWSTNQLGLYVMSIEAKLNASGIDPSLLTRFEEYGPHNKSIGWITDGIQVSQLADHLDDFIDWLKDPERQRAAKVAKAAEVDPMTTPEWVAYFEPYISGKMEYKLLPEKLKKAWKETKLIARGIQERDVPNVAAKLHAALMAQSGSAGAFAHD